MILEMRRLTFFCLFIFCWLFSQACASISIPNLEETQCTESRETVKKFYSLHFDGEMLFSSKNLKTKEKFLTPQLVKYLENLPGENDFFTTGSTDTPRAFRLGDCQVINPDKTNVEVLLLWKNENESRQQIIKVETLKQTDKWLINSILR